MRVLRVVVAVASLVAIAGCGADLNDGASGPGAPPNDAGDGPTFDGVDVTTVIVGRAESAVDLAVRPGDEALYVVEHAGRVVRLDDGDTTVVLDLSERFLGHEAEQGLNGLEFSADGLHAWIHGTTAEGMTTISELAVSPDGSIDPASERVMIDVGGPGAQHHNAGDLLRLPDDTLLITLGDGDPGVGNRPPGSPPVDPLGHGNDPGTLRSSILRVQPTPGDDTVYVIPADNPFAGGPITRPDGSALDGLPEVWAWGLRNPWKIDYDAERDQLWIADVGRADAEEINVVGPDDGRLPGRAVDFGWSRFEGTGRIDDSVDALDPPIAPVFTYPHVDIRCAISGGVVYRGAAIPELTSGYVYADFCEGSVWVFDQVTGTSRRLIGLAGGAGGIPGITGIRVGPDGELYVLGWEGDVHRIVRA